MKVARVVRKDGCDQAEPADRLERRGEEKGEIKEDA